MRHRRMWVIGGPLLPAVLLTHNDDFLPDLQLSFFCCHVCQLVTAESTMSRAPCESEMAPFLSKQVRASTILFLSELATCLDGCRFCICWILDIPFETMHTLRRETSCCTSLRAVHTACCCCWHELNPDGNILQKQQHKQDKTSSPLFSISSASSSTSSLMERVRRLRLLIMSTHKPMPINNHIHTHKSHLSSTHFIVCSHSKHTTATPASQHCHQITIDHR